MERSTAAAAVVFEVGGLWERLGRLRDSRRPRGKRYPLVLVLAVLAKLAGEDRPSGIAEWVAHRQAALAAALGLRWTRTPHHNTFLRVFAEAVSRADLDAAVGAFFREQAGAAQIVAAGGAYLWIAKDNQPSLRSEIADLFELDRRTVAGGRLP